MTPSNNDDVERNSFLSRPDGDDDDDNFGGNDDDDGGDDGDDGEERDFPEHLHRVGLPAEQQGLAFHGQSEVHMMMT